MDDWQPESSNFQATTFSTSQTTVTEKKICSADSFVLVTANFPSTDNDWNKNQKNALGYAGNFATLDKISFHGKFDGWRIRTSNFLGLASYNVFYRRSRFAFKSNSGWHSRQKNNGGSERPTTKVAVAQHQVNREYLKILNRQIHFYGQLSG